MPQPDKILTVDDFPDEHQVAVVVFANARGVDTLDAASRVQQALRHLINGQNDGFLPMPHRGYNVEGAFIEIRDIMEAGMAAGNGYLWTRPTSKAFNEYRRRKPPA